jgi:tripartite-type tricarboxylate transporter receptor subunit TctC
MQLLWRSTIAIGIVILSSAPLQTATAQDYPTKPVRIISGFGPGSAGDVLTRLVVPKLNQSTGQQFIVEYKPGAGSNIAAEFVVRAPADGYTLFLGTSANTINATLSPNLSFDFAKDLAPIAPLGSVPNILVVNPSLGVANVRELIALAKARPDQISYATSGVGSLSHMAGELLNVQAGIKLVHVPYQSAAQAVLDVLGGRVMAFFGPVNIVLPHVEAGKLKALATTENKRTFMAPDIPTMAEAADLPNYESAIWYGLLAPARTPRDVIDKLSRLANEALQAKDTLAQMRAQGYGVLGGSPQDFANAIDADVRRWREVITAAGLKR